MQEIIDAAVAFMPGVILGIGAIVVAVVSVRLVEVGVRKFLAAVSK